MSDYLADVRRYDALADEEIVEKIVKHLGIALRNRDSSLVSCSDEKERGTVRTSWCGKKLGVTDDSVCDTVIERVCRTMSRDRSKQRVTFYYLVAKHLGKLGDL